MTSDAVTMLATALAGRYEVERELGRGGMATVYLARDLKHDRLVALKVLDLELGALLGADRFLAEIRVTANLQHPHLLPLFDSGEADGLLYYVMPYVEGETLRARLVREKQLPVEDAVRIAVAVANALDYAHAHGIVHRDLKPENILLQHGQPVVADFGIALAVRNAGGARITQTGLSLGTPQYMSPEQATGDRAVDGRTDIYSLGAITYEMLVGDPPHLGSTTQAVIAKVLTEKPSPVRVARPNVPEQVEAAVARALEKLPADRFPTAQDFADALAGRLSVATGFAAAEQVAAPTRRTPTIGTRELVSAGLVLAAVAFGVVEWKRTRERPEIPVLRMSVATPKEMIFNDFAPGTNVAISPRGDRIAFTSTRPDVLFIRSLDQLEARVLPTTINARMPAFSPDGKWVAFANGNDIMKVSVDGGPVSRLASIPDGPAGISWGSQGNIVVGGLSSGLYVIPEGGGAPGPLPRAASERALWPLILPDGETVVFDADTAGSRTARLAIMSIAGGERIELGVQGTTPLGYLAGHLVYTTATGTLMAVPFDARTKRVRGAPISIAEGIVVNPNGGAKAGLSASGTLIYRSGRTESRPVLVRGGSATDLFAEARGFSDPRYSPDGTRVAFTIRTAPSVGVWVLEPRRGTLTRLTNEGVNSRPEWTSDGKRILFVSDRGGQSAFWWQADDGGSPAELLYKPDEGDPLECILSPDGKWLVYRTGPGGHPPRNIFAVALDAKSKSIPLVTGASWIQMPRLSPDGHWLAYQSNESGAFEIYVRPFPGAGGRVQISNGGGTEPLWARSGRALLYRRGQDLMSAAVTTGASFSVGAQRAVVTGEYVAGLSHPNYDELPDGSGFLMMRHAGEEVQTILVQNWLHELVARTSAPR